MTEDTSSFEEIDLDQLVSPDQQFAATAGAGTLDQADIDALFGAGDAPAEPLNAIRALVQAKAPEQQPMPMLEAICDRVAPAVAAGMRNLTTENIEVSLEQVTVGRFGDIMNMVPLPAVFGVFHLAPLEGSGVMILESSVIYTLLEALMGGKNGGGRVQPVEARSFTPLETSLMSTFMTMTLKELARNFEPVTPVSISLERSETLPRFAAVVEPAVSSAHCVFRVEMDGRPGRFRLLLPTTTLEPVREKLTQRLLGSPVRGSSAWSEHFEREIRRTMLRMDAVLAERTMTLQEIMGLQVGQTLPLGRSPHAPVTLCLEGVPVARAETGQRNHHLSVRLVTDLDVAA